MLPNNMQAIEDLTAYLERAKKHGRYPRLPICLLRANAVAEATLAYERGDVELLHCLTKDRFAHEAAVFYLAKLENENAVP